MRFMQFNPDAIRESLAGVAAHMRQAQERVFDVAGPHIPYKTSPVVSEWGERVPSIGDLAKLLGYPRTSVSTWIKNEVAIDGRVWREEVPHAA